METCCTVMKYFEFCPVHVQHFGKKKDEKRKERTHYVSLSSWVHTWLSGTALWHPIRVPSTSGVCHVAQLMGVISPINPHSCAPLLPGPLETKAVRTRRPTLPCLKS